MDTSDNPKNMLSQLFLDEMKLKLEDRKEQLETDLAGLPVHTELGDTEDDNAEEIPVDEANQDVIALMRSDLAKINKALAKLDDGTYGTDDDGKEISEARLRAMPWADKAI
jgi:RNA polymerase-binding transcription factor DksA